MKNNPRKLDYYMNLQYDLRVVRVDDDGDLAYKAYARELDQDAFYGVGATRQKAIESFEEARSELMPYFHENDITIPLPEREPEGLPSGKFMIRTSPQIHKKLVDMAVTSSISLNAMVNQILSEHTTADSLVEKASKEIRDSVCARMEQSWTKYVQKYMQWTTSRPYLGRKRAEYERAA